MTGSTLALPSGGLAQQYLGRNVAGASNLAMAQNYHYLRKITVTAPGIITSVGAYVQGQNSTAVDLRFGVWSDNAGTPKNLLAVSQSKISNTGLYLQSGGGGVTGDARWLHQPIGLYVAAGDYWIGCMSNSTVMHLFYDAGGHDKISQVTIDDLCDVGVFTVVDSGDDFSLRADFLAMGGAAGMWETLINEPGTSLSAWTANGGTWAVDAGGYIKQTDTTLAYRGLKYNTAIGPAAGIVMQADVRFPSGGATGRRAMLAPVTAQGDVSGTSEMWGGLRTGATAGAGAVEIQRGDQDTKEVTETVAVDTWYTVRTVVMGDLISVFVGGVYKRAWRIEPAATSMTLAEIPALINYTGEVHYRNIKLWRLTGPT